MEIDLPEESNPSERAILYAYSNGITEPMEIARLLRPNSKGVVYKTLRKYKNFLPELRVSQATQHICPQKRMRISFGRT